MTERRVRLLGRDPDGELYTSPLVWALLFGVDAGEVEQCMATAEFKRSGVDCFPESWHQAGYRRGHEAMAHTGSDFFGDILGYWAAESGWSLVFPTDGEVWLAAADVEEPAGGPG